MVTIYILYYNRPLGFGGILFRAGGWRLKLRGHALVCLRHQLSSTNGCDLRGPSRMSGLLKQKSFARSSGPHMVINFWKIATFFRTRQTPLFTYPLVNSHIAIENGHRNSWFTHKNGWIFHSYVNVYQRVINIQTNPNMVPACMSSSSHHKSTAQRWTKAVSLRMGPKRCTK